METSSVKLNMKKYRISNYLKKKENYLETLATVNNE